MAKIPVRIAVHADGTEGGAILEMGTVWIPIAEQAAPSIRDFSEAELLDELRRRSDLRNADDFDFEPSH